MLALLPAFWPRRAPTLLPTQTHWDVSLQGCLMAAGTRSASGGNGRSKG